MNRLTTEDRVRVISCLVEGNSIRSTVRMTGVAKNTVTKLLVEIGRACSEYQDKIFRNLQCKRIQCDEIWSYIASKEKNTSPEKKTKGNGNAPFTRLTNAFSKKLENHEHAVALYFMYYNFARVHQTLRVTPAMEA